MSSWFFSLQFQLVLGFGLVLALALGGVSLYVGYAARQETDRFQQELEEARAARIERVVSRHFGPRRVLSGLQPAIEQAGSLYGWRIVVSDQAGSVLADSHRAFGPSRRAGGQRSRFFPLFSDGREIGSLAIAPSDAPGVAPEPAVSRLVSATNRSLLWTGLGAGFGGILLVSLMSRRVLSPVRVLSSAARRLGQGDLSQRVSASTRDEVGQLSHTFNAMAEGLQAAERQRRSLMADVAHELRTPLSNIQGYLEAVKDGLLQPDTATIDTIYQQVLYLSHLVEDLRLLALAEAGVLRLERGPHDLEDLLRGAVEAVRPRADAKGVTLDLEVLAAPLLVHVDRTRIAQVVGNLLENALSHTPEGGSVRVSAAAAGDVMRVTVADTGEGIPPEDLPHVFNRFYRVDPSRARATGGVGLGLTIARQLVEAHGGTIHAESAPGGGSRFIFDLPLEAAQGGER